MTTRHLLATLALSSAICLAVGCRTSVPAEFAANARPPFIAIWEDFSGLGREFEAPCLRIAIWDDGRVLFARDPNKWAHHLRQGRIDQARITELKKAITENGVFDLKGTCYLAIDAPVVCLLLDFDKHQQMLYWDEWEILHMGNGANTESVYSEFKRRWKTVNKLALDAIPPQSQPYRKTLPRPPDSWRLRKETLSK